jgi:hypothetical protein
MSLINTVRNFIINNKRILSLIIIILLAFFLDKLNKTIKEGLELPSCSVFNTNQSVEKNCANCLAVKLNSADTKCYWNETEKKCGSFLGNGYKDTCATTTNINTNTCPNCPKLQILDTPTWFADPVLKSSTCPTCPKMTIADTPTWITKV